MYLMYLSMAPQISNATTQEVKRKNGQANLLLLNQAGGGQMNSLQIQRLELSAR